MIKRFGMVLALLVVCCGLGGCGNEARESDFMIGFSLGSIIEANAQFLVSQEIASGGTVAGPAQSLLQRREEAIVQVEPPDIPAFMAAVQSDVERSLVDSGAKVVGSGGGRQGAGVSPADIVEFDLRYNVGQVDGVVNVWGVRGQGTSLILIVLLTESPKA